MCIDRLETSPVHRKKITPSNAKDTKDRQMQTRQIMEWFRSSLCTNQTSTYLKDVGKSRVPVMLGTQPEESIRAREIDDKHVDEIYESIDKKGVSRTDIILLVWKEELDDMGVEISEMPMNNTALTFHTVCGGHTLTAIQRKHKEDPSDVQFQTVDVEFLIVERSMTNVEMAYLFGKQDNDTKALTKGMNTWDTVVKIHREVLSVGSKNIGAPAKKKALQDAMCKLYVSVSHDITKNTFGSLRVLGQKTGKLWENVHAIFSRPQLPLRKGVKAPPPPSVSHFYNMSDIPETKLVMWSGYVLDNNIDYSTLDFYKKCHKYKKIKRVKKLVTEHVNTIRPDGKQHRDYEDVARTYNGFANPDWFEKIVKWTSEVVKEGLNGSVKQQIAAAIQAQERAAGNKSNSNVIQEVHTQKHLQKFWEKIPHPHNYIHYNDIYIYIYVRTYTSQIYYHSYT